MSKTLKDNPYKKQEKRINKKRNSKKDKSKMRGLIKSIEKYQ